MSWKDHPGIVATVAAAGTLAFAYSTLLPMYTQHQTVKIENLEQENSQLTKRAELAERRADTLAVNYAKATSQNIFTKESPYPIGWRDVKLGAHYSQVTEFYGTRAEVQKRYTTIRDNDNAFFSSATYYPVDGKDFIGGILFGFNSEKKKDLGVKSLVKTTTSLISAAFPLAKMTLGDDEGTYVFSNAQQKKMFEISEFGVTVYINADQDGVQALAKLEKAGSRT